MSERDLSDAERNDLLEQHLRTLSHWHEADDGSTNAAETDATALEAQAAQDAYLRASKVPPADG